MVGLLAVVSLVAWLMACTWLSNKLGNSIGKVAWRPAVKWLIFFFLNSTLLVDEFMAKQQFEKMCAANGIENADISYARGKKVVAENSVEKRVSGTYVPMYETNMVFADAQSGEALILYKVYRSEGGWLKRFTWLRHFSSGPILYPSSCYDPEQIKTVLDNVILVK